ncbi:hypothetical protein AAFF_G00304650 [Aldrovandia affinis]|uniref:Selenoprotein P N-terminal domain-containing protein n=1 Tax=Aldrovandia affinis TaxID=143900 RepID=A0AAD7SP98_9TELE|nr:hypothetical protein AAFF_G00304650 [Aldrovandia affinis]
MTARRIQCAVGVKGYEFLRELGYPLPSYRTLSNRLKPKIMVPTTMQEELAELGLGVITTYDSPEDNGASEEGFIGLQEERRRQKKQVTVGEERWLKTMQLWGLGALCLAALPGLLWAGPVFVEGDNDPSKICKPPPHWEIAGQAPMKGHQGKASRLGDLRDKLARGGLRDVGFLIVNEQEAQSRAMFWELKRRVAEGIPVYQQTALQDDVWEALEGDKDDFLVYDRCGRLTFHIVLPYSFLHYPFIEAAIRATYYKDICGNCSVDHNSTLSAQWNSTQRNDTQLTAVNANVTAANGSEGLPPPAAVAVDRPQGKPDETPLPEGGAVDTPHASPPPENPRGGK